MPTIDQLFKTDIEPIEPQQASTYVRQHRLVVVFMECVDIFLQQHPQ